MPCRADAQCGPFQRSAPKTISGPASRRQQETAKQVKSVDQGQGYGDIQARRSADAAEAQTVYAFEQARVAAVGAGLGLVTMFAAIAAAIYAALAAHHTKRGADAADTSLNEARAALGFSHDTNRPWLSISALVFKRSRWLGPPRINASYSVKNNGTFPAFQVQTHETVTFIGDQKSFDEAVIAAKQFGDGGALIVPQDELRRDFHLHGNGCLLIVMISYRLAPNGERHFTVQAFELDRAGGRVRARPNHLSAME